MRAPGGEPMNAARQGHPIKMATDEFGKLRKLFGSFLHEQEIGPFAFNKNRNVHCRRACPAQQIPADNSQFSIF